MTGQPKYRYEVVLVIDVSDGNTEDPVTQDKSLIRKKSPPDRVARFIHRPSDQLKPPVPDPSQPVTGSFAFHLEKLIRKQPSRLTIFSHGLPGRIGVTHPWPGYEGAKMASLLKSWGLRQVTRISVIACHGAVSRKLDEARLRPRSFNFNLRTKHQDLFALLDEDGAGLLEENDKEEIELLNNSFAQQFHKALAQPFPHAVRTEVTARVNRMKASDQGRNHVEFDEWMPQYSKDFPFPLPFRDREVQVAHKAPGSKFLFYWRKQEGGADKQAVQSVYYDERDDF